MATGAALRVEQAVAQVAQRPPRTQVGLGPSAGGAPGAGGGEREQRAGAQQRVPEAGLRRAVKVDPALAFGCP